jgi:hypothetical protein
MSTYLVAYVIGYYDYVETRDSNNVLIRVYTPIGKKEQGLFALDVSRFFLREVWISNDRFRLQRKSCHFMRNISVLNTH